MCAIRMMSTKSLCAWWVDWWGELMDAVETFESSVGITWIGSGRRRWRLRRLW
jgi:hypothetical protein